MPPISSPSPLRHTGLPLSSLLPSLCTHTHLLPIQSLCSLRGIDGMHFAFVPMTLARAVTVGTVLGYTVLYTVKYTTSSE